VSGHWVRGRNAIDKKKEKMVCDGCETTVCCVAPVPPLETWDDWFELENWQIGPSFFAVQLRTVVGGCQQRWIVKHTCQYEYIVYQIKHNTVLTLLFLALYSGLLLTRCPSICICHSHPSILFCSFSHYQNLLLPCHVLV